MKILDTEVKIGSFVRNTQEVMYGVEAQTEGVRGEGAQVLQDYTEYYDIFFRKMQHEKRYFEF